MKYSRGKLILPNVAFEKLYNSFYFVLYLASNYVVVGERSDSQSYGYGFV